ncbi:MAG: hypothetical protein Q7S11_01180 [bacterium]|nr:hypothetical protein [bacterium]
METFSKYTYILGWGVCLVVAIFFSDTIPDLLNDYHVFNNTTPLYSILTFIFLLPMPLFFAVRGLRAGYFKKFSKILIGLTIILFFLSLVAIFMTLTLAPH